MLHRYYFTNCSVGAPYVLRSTIAERRNTTLQIAPYCSVRIKISYSQAAVADGVKAESVGEFILSFS